MAAQRATGIDIIGVAPWGTHFCQFYQTRKDLQEVLVPYFKAGLESNEFCMWVTSPDLTKPQAEAALKKAIPQFKRYVEKGQIEILPHTEWYLKDGYFDLQRVLNGWVEKLNYGLAKGFEGLRLTGNTIWLEKKDWKGFTAYEAAINEVIGQYRMIALCTYSLKKCGAFEILDVVRNHEFALVKRQSGWDLLESSHYKQARETLRQSEERYHSLFSSMSEGFALNEIICDQNGHPCDYRFIDVNPAFERLTGLKAKNVVGKTVREILPDIESSWIETYGQVALTGEAVHFERSSMSLDKYYAVTAYSPRRGQFAALFVDITESKKIQEALQETQERQRVIFDALPSAIFAKDLQGRYIFMNEQAKAWSQRNGGMQLGKTDSNLFPAAVAEEHSEEDQEVLTNNKTVAREKVVPHPDGPHTHLVSKFPLRDSDGKPYAVCGISTDITERKQKEEQLQKLIRTLKALSNGHVAMMRASNELEYLREVCRVVVEDCGHRLVWIGYAQQDEAKSVRPVAHAGFEEGYLGTLKISWADTERGRGPTGTAIRTRQPSICRNMLTDARFLPWREEAVKRGYASSMALPLISEGEAFGAITIYSPDPDPYSQDEVSLLTQLANDLAYGITALRLREARRIAEEALRRSEERYRTLVELSPDALLINQKNRFTFVNSAAVKLFGASNAQELVGKSPFDLFHPDFHTAVRARIERLLHGESVTLTEEKIARMDGTVVDVDVAAAPLSDVTGTSIQVILRNISDRKHAERRLNLLAETAGQLLATDSPQEIVEGLCRKVMEHLDCHAFFNFLVDTERQCLHLNACGGIPEEEARRIEWLDYGVAVCGCAARDGCRIVAEDIFHRPDPRTELVKSYGIQAYACHPLIVQGKVLGTLSFGTRNRAQFTPDELSLMKAVADQVAIAMERKRNQKALQQANAELEKRVAERTREVREKSRFLEAFFHHSLDSLVFLDTKFNFIRVNEAYAKAAARPLREFIGRNHFELYPDAENEAIFSNVVRTKTPYLASAKPFVYPDHPEWGVTYWDWSLVPVLDHRGEVDFLVFSLRDVTKRERAEQELNAASRYARSLLEASLDPLVTISPDGKITDVNAATELATGVNRENLVGSDFSNYFTEPAKAAAGYQKVLADGFVQDYPLTIRQVSGGTMDVLYNATVYRNPVGAVQGVFAAARDITERHRAEAELTKYRDHLEELVKQRTSELEAANTQLQLEIAERKRAEENLRETAVELARSNEDLEQFAYVASHDLQEPLRAVAGYVGLLHRRRPESLDAKALHYLEGATDGALRMQKLIDDLLAFSRVQTRGKTFAASDLGNALEQALANLSFTIRETEAKISSDPLPSLRVDATQITQLLQNLIGNAIKFRGDTSPQIHVGAEKQDSQWVFSVRDNGIGIEPQYYQRIFQIFQRLHNRKTYPGTGIGLAICKKIVERHGGEIWVESKPGQGCTFFFSIPLEQSEPNPLKTPSQVESVVL